jgi:hypothetical protein
MSNICKVQIINSYCLIGAGNLCRELDPKEDTWKGKFRDLISSHLCVEFFWNLTLRK